MKTSNCLSKGQEKKKHVSGLDSGEAGSILGKAILIIKISFLGSYTDNFRIATFLPSISPVRHDYMIVLTAVGRCENGGMYQKSGIMLPVRVSNTSARRSSSSVCCRMLNTGFVTMRLQLWSLRSCKSETLDSS